MTLTMTPTVDAGGPATDIRRAEPAGGEPDPRASAQTTRIHSVEGVEVGPRRRVRSARLDDRFNVLGAAAAGIAVAVLLFGWFTPLSGGVGWVLVAFVAFLGFYALLVSLSSDWQEVKDRVMAVLLTGANQDGARGLKAIKKRGGYIVVQDPITAEAPVMPAAGIAAVEVDQILPLQEIGQFLADRCGAGGTP